jgi:outer membrane protein TolC
MSDRPLSGPGARDRAARDLRARSRAFLIPLLASLALSPALAARARAGALPPLEPASALAAADSLARAAARPLTFEQALAELSARNGQWRAARADERRAAALRGAARALYLPRAELAGRWTRIDAPIELDLDPIRDVILKLHPAVPPALVPHFIEPVQDREFWKAELQASWPLFTGGRILAANRAAAAELTATREEGRATEGTLVAELARRYFGLRLAERVVEVRHEVLDALTRHHYEAMRLEQEGLVARAERLHADVALAEADRAWRRSVRDAALARAALADLLASDTAVAPASPLFLADVSGDAAAFADTAARANPLLGQLAARREQARAARRAEAGTWLPAVSLFALKELVPEDLTILDPEWAVGVGASWTLFDGLGREHRVAAARRLEDRVDALRDAAAHGVATLVEKRWQELTQAREQWQSLEATRELADENVRVRERAFAQGLATSLDVVDARLARARVEVERLSAARDADVALAELLAASGRIEDYARYRSRADQEVER